MLINLDGLKARSVITEEGCWLWQGYLNRDGYGVLTRQTQRHFVHRLSVIASGREYPSGFVTDHLCRNRACCNPDHLEVVTTAENLRRGRSSQHKRELAMITTHCSKGHEYTPENVYYQPNGQRVCRTCKLEWARARRTRIGQQARLAGIGPAPIPGNKKRNGLTNEQLAAKDACAAGHPYTPENTRWRYGTQRLCKECMRLYSLARRRRYSIAAIEQARKEALG